MKWPQLSAIVNLLKQSSQRRGGGAGRGRDSDLICLFPRRESGWVPRTRIQCDAWTHRSRKFGPGRRWLGGGGGCVVPGDTAQEGHRLGSILPIIQITMGAGLPVSDSHPATVTITQSRWRQRAGGREEEEGGGGAYVTEAGAHRYMKCVNMCVK